MKSTLLCLALFSGTVSFGDGFLNSSHESYETASVEQLVTVAYTNINMEINLSVLLNNKSIDQFHIQGKAYNKTFNTTDLKKGIVILSIGGDLVRLQSDDFEPLSGGTINMDYLKDKKTETWERSEFSAAFNHDGKVALYQEGPFSLCEIDHLNFEFSKSNIGLPKGVNSILGTCKSTAF